MEGKFWATTDVDLGPYQTWLEVGFERDKWIPWDTVEVVPGQG